MSEWKPNEQTLDFLQHMRDRGMKMKCPECGRDCFCPNVAQTRETMQEGILVAWCTDHGHWGGDVRHAKWVKPLI